MSSLAEYGVLPGRREALAPVLDRVVAEVVCYGRPLDHMTDPDLLFYMRHMRVRLAVPRTLYYDPAVPDWEDDGGSIG